MRRPLDARVFDGDDAPAARPRIRAAAAVAEDAVLRARVGVLLRHRGERRGQLRVERQGRHEFVAAAAVWRRRGGCGFDRLGWRR